MIQDRLFNISPLNWMSLHRSGVPGTDIRGQSLTKKPTTWPGANGKPVLCN